VELNDFVSYLLGCIQVRKTGKASELLNGIAKGVTMASVFSLSPVSSSGQEIHATPRKGRIKQSVSRWCYPKIPLDERC